MDRSAVELGQETCSRAWMPCQEVLSVAVLIGPVAALLFLSVYRQGSRSPGPGCLLSRAVPWDLAPCTLQFGFVGADGQEAAPCLSQVLLL